MIIRRCVFVGKSCQLWQTKPDEDEVEYIVDATNILVMALLIIVLFLYITQKRIIFCLFVLSILNLPLLTIC